ncbi:MAG: hypothetical protein K6A33_08800 [Clostridiales bacterium]|nr:hypothetical protein [Clostridiales bacterium]
MTDFETIPAFPGGTPVDGVYDAGPMLADDQNGPMDEDAKMRFYTGATDEDIARYAGILEENGFRGVKENENDAYHAVSGSKGQTNVYAYLTKATGTVRLIHDVPGSSYECLSSDAEADGAEEICQYALYYDPVNGHSPTTTNCGMFYIIRLADRSLFLIDGGDELQCSEEALTGMYRFLRAFTGVPEGERMKIAGWFFTHAHGDHVAACIRLLRTYPDAFDVERILYNFPSHFTVRRRCDEESFVLKETLREFAPHAAAVKLHSGMRFTLAGTVFDVLYTHEDAIRPEAPEEYPFRDFNCTSTVLRMTTKSGGVVMWLGDTNTETEALVAKTVPASMWKSDVVQIAHHCFNYLSTLYPMIDADYAMLPNSHYGGHTVENEPKLAEVVACLADHANLWYEDQTTVFRFEDGAYRVVKTLPRVGGEHDGTDLYGNRK